MPSRLSRTKKTLIGTSVALGSFGIGGAAFAVVNGGGATAAGTAPATASTAKPGATQGQKVRMFLRRHTVHSTLTVQTKNGFETVNLIRGTVTAWGGGSITVQAADNSSVTASITPQTKFHNTTEQTLGKGQKVGLVAVGGNARLIAAPASSSTAG
jgi:hypothetical protein